MKVLGKNLPQKLRITNSGFTLIELMVTIAVLAIIVSIAAPSISTQLANQRVKSTTATLVNALKEAKVESVIRRQGIELRHSNDGDNTIAIGKNLIFDTTKPNNCNSSSFVSKPVADPNASPKPVAIAMYQYSAKSIIKAPINKACTIFLPRKRIDLGVTYTICDINTAASPRQVIVSTLGSITSQLGGTCP